MGRFFIVVMSSALLSTCAVSNADIPLDDVFIVMERHSCFGSCPVYGVKIYGDGLVQYDGKRYVAHKGEASWRVEPAVVVELVNLFLAARFFDALPRYDSRELVDFGETGDLVLLEKEVTDLPTTVLTLKLGDREHSVFMYYNVPNELRELTRAVDEMTGTKRYVSDE